MLECLLLDYILKILVQDFLLSVASQNKNMTYVSKKIKEGYGDHNFKGFQIFL